MFKCDNCGKTSGTRRPATKVVTEYREVEYPVYYFKKLKKDTRMILNREVSDEELSNLKADKWILDSHKIVKGKEIVSEKTVCEECRDTYEQT